jgi:hypothetical protein
MTETTIKARWQSPWCHPPTRTIEVSCSTEYTAKVMREVFERLHFDIEREAQATENVAA